jgi:hypothetical protein
MRSEIVFDPYARSFPVVNNDCAIDIAACKMKIEHVRPPGPELRFFCCLRSQIKPINLLQKRFKGRQSKESRVAAVSFPPRG